MFFGLFFFWKREVFGEKFVRDSSLRTTRARRGRRRIKEDAREDDDGKQKRRSVVVGAPLFTRGTFAAF